MATETLDTEQETARDRSESPAEASPDDALDAAPTPRTAPVVVGFAVTALFLLFLAFGRVTVYVAPESGGVRETRELRVVRIWTLLHDNLPQVEHQDLLRITLDVALVVLIVSIAACLWLALAASPRAEQPSESSDGGA